MVRAYKQRVAANRQIELAAQSLTAAKLSFDENLARILRGAGLPIEVLQPIQALATARIDYLEAVLDYNRAQFRLRRAVGQF